MAGKQRIPDAAIIDALKATKGMVYLAAKKLGCHADTIYTRAKAQPKVAEVIKDERGAVVDTAELKLHSAILNGEPWAVALTLKTLGRDRGYGERPARDIGDPDLGIARDRIGLHDLHMARLRALFVRCIESGDLRTALAVMRDEAQLHRLYQLSLIPPGDGTESSGDTPAAALARLKSASARAAAAADGLLGSASETTRLGAARAVLDNSLRYREVGEFEARLEELEAIMKQRDGDKEK